MPCSPALGRYLGRKRACIRIFWANCSSNGLSCLTLVQIAQKVHSIPCCKLSRLELHAENTILNQVTSSASEARFSHSFYPPFPQSSSVNDNNLYYFLYTLLHMTHRSSEDFLVFILFPWQLASPILMLYISAVHTRFVKSDKAAQTFSPRARSPEI
jgi:hypothetical protein